MATITLTMPVAGTVITAGLHSNNYTAIQAAVNGGLDQNNFAAGKIFDNTKIMQGGALVGQGLQWNGTSWVPANAGVYRKTTAKTVVNSVVETDLLNGEITVGAGVLGTSGVLRLTAWGDWKQNSGAATDIPRFKLKLGATTLIDTNILGGNVIGNSATRYGWKICAEIMNLGAANAQWATIDGKLTSAVSALGATAAIFTTGEGDTVSLWGTAAQSLGAAFLGGNSAAEDTTAAKALVLSVILPVANAATDIVLKGATVEVV